MSAPITRGQLKTRAMQRADFGTSTYIDQSAGGELEQLVDTELRKLWDFEVQMDPERCMRGPFYLSSVTGQKLYQMPNDLMNLHSIYFVPDPTSATGRRIPLRRFDASEYGVNANYFTWGPPPILYRIIGDHQIQFDPAPTQSQTNIIEYYYIPGYTPPAGDSTPLGQFVIPGWEDYVVDGVAANLRLKEGADEAPLLLQKQAAFEMKLSTQIADRDRFKPSKFQDMGWAESDPGFGWGQGYFGFYGSW